MIAQRYNLLNQRTTTFVVLSLMVYAFAIYAYANLRYQGQWSEPDTMHLSRAIYAANEGGSLIDSSRPYGNGMTYQAISVFILQLSGISLSALQHYIYIVVNVMLPVVAFITYNQIIKNRVVAALATLLLFTQPDFLFVTWRGSHEKITWMMALLLLFFLTRSFSLSDKKTVSQNVFSLLIVSFAFLCSNVFFASSVFTVLTLAYFGGVILFWIRRRFYGQGESDALVRSHINRLGIIVLSRWVLLYMFFFYLYPPSFKFLQALRSFVEGFALLFLESSTTEAANPYAYVSSVWVDTRIFLLVSIFSIAIALTSLLFWVVRVPRYFRPSPIRHQELNHLFLWLIFGAAGFQIAFSLVADLTNAIGSNLQVRLFTLFTLIAVMLAALAIFEIAKLLKRPTHRVVFASILAVVMIPLSMLSMFKMTNEPVISNKWIFNVESERVASDWILENDLHTRNVWSGLTDRLLVMNLMENPGTSLNFDSNATPTSGIHRYFLVSDLEMMLWRRVNFPLPDLSTENIIYDNGPTEIYHRRPRTPYQD